MSKVEALLILVCLATFLCGSRSSFLQVTRLSGEFGHSATLKLLPSALSHSRCFPKFGWFRHGNGHFRDSRAAAAQRRQINNVITISMNQYDNNNNHNEDAKIPLNELHTKLRDAVLEQDFDEAGRISDIFLNRLYGHKLANANLSPIEREKMLQSFRKRMSWKGLGAAPWLIARLDSLNFTFPTTIQINAMESVNAILKDNPMDASMEERIGRNNMDMGIVISGTTGSGKSLAYLVPLLSTLTDSLFARQRRRVGAEQMVGDITGDLLDRLAMVTSPLVRSTTRNMIRSSSTTSPITTGAALSSLGKSGKDVRSPLALIVVPTRELGVQIAMVLYQLVGGNIKESPTEFSGRANMFKYKGPKGVRIGCVLDEEESSFGLKLQTDVAITMPQYLGKLLEDKDIDANKLRVIVFDEADLALEETPSSTLKALFDDRDASDDEAAGDDDDEEDNEFDERLKREYSRLTFLVGASVTEALGTLAVSSRILPPGRSYIATATSFSPLLSQEPEGSDVINKSDFLLREPQTSLQNLNLCLYPGLKHFRALVDDDTGLLVLTRLLRKELREADEDSTRERPRVVVFFPNEAEAKAAIEPLRDALWGEHRLCVLLPKTGFSPLTILDQFRRNETTVMLATPNSVRGLDVQGLTHVYTLYLPMDDPREYVHLAGRVGRVGQAPASSGGGANVISILRRSEANQMDELAKTLGFEFTDLDTTSMYGFPQEVGTINSRDDVTDDDVEAMRRYLEDTLNLLKLAQDPTVRDVEATMNESISDGNDAEEDEDDEEDDEEG